jgi:pimeloyl-ACP methyl ester carboxylesterase
MKTETLQVPGASRYCEVRGSGPVLLMIPGGPMDAGGSMGIADRLAGTGTVVTYDCRGNSRSPVRTLVAHEPPVSELLPDAARYHTLNQQAGETCRSEGTSAAVQMFTKGSGFGNGGPPARGQQTPEEAAEEARMGPTWNCSPGG